MKVISEIKDSNIFSGGMLLKGSTKTGVNLSAKQERLCSTCGRYKDRKCKYLGKIKYPNRIYCSWYEENNE